MAVWEAFLSERDKAHANLHWGKREPFGFGAKPVLLVIDNSYGVLGPRLPVLEAAPHWPMSCGLEGWEAIDRTVDLIASARANGIPVVYPTRHENFPGSGVARGRGGRSKPSRETPFEDLYLRQNEIVDEIKPQPGDLLIPKTGPSVFFGTALVSYLTEIGADTVICCGNSTSGCLRATVVDACSARYRVGVVEECTFDRTEASHAMSLFDMNVKYADVISVAEAAQYFESVTQRERVPALAGTS
jgi:nicotinamidase-related amidase